MKLIYKLFATPLIKFPFTKHQDYIFDDVEKSERVPPDWECSINSSYPKIHHQDPFIDTKKSKSLQKDLLKDIKSAFVEMNIPSDISMVTFWYNIYHDNQYQERHNHRLNVKDDNSWSGIYYSKNSTPTTFYPPTTIGRISDFPGSEDTLLSDCFFTSFNPDVEDGDIIVFPSTIEHQVRPSQSNQMRLTFSFNLRFN